MNRLRIYGIRYNSSKISTIDYHKKSDIYIDNLLEYLEEIGDFKEDFDVIYSSGVLTLKIKENTFVINKQPPNQQIWLSSPITGPKRFYYEKVINQWIDTKNQKNIKSILDEELTMLLKQKINTPF